jgi:hypothetical protein
MKKLLIIIAWALSVLVSRTSCQTRHERLDAARSQIKTLLSKTAEAPYRELGELIDVDSSNGLPEIADGQITDPYGTLKRCFLYMATTQGEQGTTQKHSIGVYKDNQIIWNSGLLAGSENYGYITDEGFLATKDLTHTGKVAIVVYFSDGTNPPSDYYCWIFSWDGRRGTCINKCDADGETSITSSGAFLVRDIDGDGLDEIQSYSAAQSRADVYKWDGSLFSIHHRRARNK